jgi:hypothetical protein
MIYIPSLPLYAVCAELMLLHVENGCDDIHSLPYTMGLRLHLIHLRFTSASLATVHALHPHHTLIQT